MKYVFLLLFFTMIRVAHGEPADTLAPFPIYFVRDGKPGEITVSIDGEEKRVAWDGKRLRLDQGHSIPKPKRRGGWPIRGIPLEKYTSLIGEEGFGREFGFTSNADLAKFAAGCLAVLVLLASVVVVSGIFIFRWLNGG
jgi:hypothetical protein